MEQLPPSTLNPNGPGGDSDNGYMSNPFSRKYLPDSEQWPVTFAEDSDYEDDYGMNKEFGSGDVGTKERDFLNKKLESYTYEQMLQFGNQTFSICKALLSQFAGVKGTGNEDDAVQPTPLISANTNETNDEVVDDPASSGTVANAIEGNVMEDGDLQENAANDPSQIVLPNVNQEGKTLESGPLDTLNRVQAQKFPSLNMLFKIFIEFIIELYSKNRYNPLSILMRMSSESKIMEMGFLENSLYLEQSMEDGGDEAEMMKASMNQVDAYKVLWCDREETSKIFSSLFTEINISKIEEEIPMALRIIHFLNTCPILIKEALKYPETLLPQVNEILIFSDFYAFGANEMESGLDMRSEQIENAENAQSGLLPTSGSRRLTSHGGANGKVVPPQKAVYLETNNWINALSEKDSRFRSGSFDSTSLGNNEGGGSSKDLFLSKSATSSPHSPYFNPQKINKTVIPLLGKTRLRRATGRADVGYFANAMDTSKHYFNSKKWKDPLKSFYDVPSALSKNKDVLYL